VDHGDHNPPWWTRSVQDHLGPRSDIFLITIRGNPRNPQAPTALATARTCRAPRSPLANRPAPVSSSSLATSLLASRSRLTSKGALTTRQWARFKFDDDYEVPGSPSRPPTKWHKQGELAEGWFNSFRVSFRGSDHNRIHSTTYTSVNEFTCLVLWVRKRAPQLSTRLMLLQTTTTQRNDEYLAIFPGMELSASVELCISHQGSWHVVLMMAQGNRPNPDSFVGLLAVAIAPESDPNHGVLEEIMPDHTSQEEDEREPRRCNCIGNWGPEESREGPFWSPGSSEENRSTSGEGATEAGDNAGDWGSDQSGEDDDGAADGNSDSDSDSDDDDNDLYSHPRM